MHKAVFTAYTCQGGWLSLTLSSLMMLCIAATIHATSMRTILWWAEEHVLHPLGEGQGSVHWRRAHLSNVGLLAERSSCSCRGHAPHQGEDSAGCQEVPQPISAQNEAAALLWHKHLADVRVGDDELPNAHTACTHRAVVTEAQHGPLCAFC